MRSVGMSPVVVHGGGPQIGELMARLGKMPEFLDGLRVTDAETLDIARMVLVGKVNRDIVSAINVHGPLAVGVSGEDAGLIERRRPRPRNSASWATCPGGQPRLLLRLLAEDLVPVVATIGSDGAGQAYNINADTAAGAIAEALGAEKLVYLTDVDGHPAGQGDPHQSPEPAQHRRSRGPDRDGSGGRRDGAEGPVLPSTPSAGAWPRPTSSTAGQLTRCCSRFSPGAGSAPW